MDCLNIEQIYLFLEQEMSPDEMLRIQKHLDSCPRCVNAVEDRRALILAANSLPQIEVPPDFRQQVMAAIFPDKVPLSVWVKSIAAGLSSTVFAFLLYYIFSGKNLADLFISIGQFFLSVLSALSTGLAKILKLAGYLVNILFDLVRLLIKGFVQLTTLLSPEAQFIIIAITLFLSALLLFGVRRKFMMGEKA